MLDKDKYTIQIYTLMDFYNLYDDPSIEFENLVKEDREYFKPKRKDYEFIKRDKFGRHIVVFDRKTNEAISHLGFRIICKDFKHIQYIFHVYTLEQYRQQGIISHVIKTLLKNNVYKTGLRVDPNNGTAIRLYNELYFIKGPTDVVINGNDNDIEYVYYHNNLVPFIN